MGEESGVGRERSGPRRGSRSTHGTEKRREQRDQEQDEADDAELRERLEVQVVCVADVEERGPLAEPRALEPARSLPDERRVTGHRDGDVPVVRAKARRGREEPVGRALLARGRRTTVAHVAHAGDGDADHDEHAGHGRQHDRGAPGDVRDGHARRLRREERCDQAEKRERQQ